MPFPLDMTFLISAKGVVSLLLLSSIDSSSDESFVKLPGSTNKLQHKEVKQHLPAGLTILIILFFIRNCFADVGTIGDEDDEAIDDGPGPASAVIVYTICYMLFVD